MAARNSDALRAEAINGTLRLFVSETKAAARQGCFDLSDAE